MKAPGTIRTLAAIVPISLLAIADAEGQDGSRVRTTMFHGLELPYEVVDGQAVYAGDIILGTAQEAAAHAPRAGRNRHPATAVGNTETAASAVAVTCAAPIPERSLYLTSGPDEVTVAEGSGLTLIGRAGKRVSSATSGLSTTGKERGIFGTGIPSSKTHRFRRVTR